MPQHPAFVEANTTGTGMIALRTAREAGFVPVFLTSDATRYAGLDETGAEVVLCDTNTPAALRAALDSLPAGSLAGITTTSEFYVPAVAQMARELDLPGNPPDAVRRARDKAQVRAALVAAGVPQPRFAVARTPDELDDAVSRVGLPCVVKPVDDSGSQLVRRCLTRAELNEHTDRVLAVRTNVRGQEAAGAVLLEEFLDAPEYSVETFSVAGEHTCVGITQKSVTSGPHFVETRHIYPAPLDDEQQTALRRAAIDALRVLDIQNGPCHIEVKLTDADATLIELNPRLAGGMIPELIRLAEGVDLLDQQIHAASGGTPDLRPRRRGHAGVAFLLPTTTGTLRRITGTTQAAALPDVERVTVTGTPGRRLRPAQSAYDRLGSVIAHGGHPGEVEATLDKALALLRIDVDG